MALPTSLPFQPQFNYPNNKMYQMEVYPVLLSATFTVAATDGKGITGLTGGGIANVFMHTSTTPAVGNYAVLNPNPASGIILVQLQNQFAKLLGMQASLQAPVTGSNLTSVTLGSVYTITALGSATAAQWIAKGLPVGVTAALGQTFLASATGTIGGSATVKIAGVSGVATIQVAGDPTGTLVNANVYQNGGGQILLQCLGAVFAGSALGTHNHDLKVIGGQAASTTNNIANYAGPILGKQEATDATYPGSAAATNGGVVGASAGTPAGTVSFGLAAPADGTVIRLSLYLSNSSVTVNGQ